MSFWTDDREDFVRRHWAKFQSQELATLFNEQFGTTVTGHAVYAKGARMGLPAKTGDQPASVAPWNPARDGSGVGRGAAFALRAGA